MNSILRQAIRTGVILGLVLLFIYLSGFAIIISTILGEFVNLESNSLVGSYGGLVILIALLAAFAGAVAVRRDKPMGWGQAILAGAATGLASGLVSIVFLVLIGLLRANASDVRNYLAQLS
ncbi:MAG TPA: hypothetical protein VLS48_05735, partial [Anaerolineales bacterium]|nr:hypothetical protein [Anaerolineales bacterium]